MSPYIARLTVLLNSANVKRKIGTHWSAWLIKNKFAYLALSGR